MLSKKAEISHRVPTAEKPLATASSTPKFLQSAARKHEFPAMADGGVPEACCILVPFRNGPLCKFHGNSVHMEVRAMGLLPPLSFGMGPMRMRSGCIGTAPSNAK